MILRRRTRHAKQRGLAPEPEGFMHSLSPYFNWIDIFKSSVQFLIIASCMQKSTQGPIVLEVERRIQNFMIGLWLL